MESICLAYVNKYSINANNNSNKYKETPCLGDIMDILNIFL